MTASNNSLVLTDMEKVEIDKELTPILAELLTLGQGNAQHPSVKQLFNWLVEPERSPGEFNYAIGELADDVAAVMQEHFQSYMYDEWNFPYLCSAAAEAMARRCPVLEGSWEITAWTLLGASSKMVHIGEIASDVFHHWIIHVIYDPDICPNPYLRYELMTLLKVFFDVRKCDQTQLIESILSACSTIDLSYFEFGLCESIKDHNIISISSKGLSEILEDPEILEDLVEHLDGYDKIETKDILNIIEKLETNCFTKIDNRISKSFEDFKSSRCSVLVDQHKVMKYTYFKESRALFGLLTILQSESRSLPLIIQDIRNGICDEPDVTDKIDDILPNISQLMTLFPSSCRTPLLIGQTSACIMNIVEILVTLHETSDDKKLMMRLNQDRLSIMQTLLDFFFNEDWNHLTVRPICLQVTKGKLPNNGNTWDFEACYNLFEETFPEYA